MKSLLFILLIMNSFIVQAAEPSILTCKPDGNAWFDAGKSGAKQLNVSRRHGLLNGKALTITINFKRHIVTNHWGNKSAIETLVHSAGNVYYIKGREKAEYYGSYSFSDDYRSAIYSADGGFVSFLECKSNST